MDPARPVGIYLDTTALIDVAEGLDGRWVPPPELDDVARRRIAVAQLLFYGRRPHPVDGRRRELWCSRMGRRELATTADWTEPVLLDVSEAVDGPAAELVRVEGERIRVCGIKEQDAEHLAWANLTGWIDVFVTDDRKLRRRSAEAGLRPGLAVMGAVDAAASLGIAPGDEPITVPTEGNPLSRLPQWWVA